MRMNVDQGECRLEHGHEKLFTDPAEREAGERDPKLRGGKVSVQVRAHVFGKNRAQIPFLRQLIQLAAADFDDSKFTRHEKGVKHHQCSDHRELTQEKQWRIPMVRNRPSQRAGCEN